mmetsp:Transcript_46166/g.90947  ORF Transcript_46166/g.90947 Transcript_46166/m.90947 type:complete len:202 (+) Transcript_46166:111-716(+)
MKVSANLARPAWVSRIESVRTTLSIGMMCASVWPRTWPVRAVVAVSIPSMRVVPRPAAVRVTRVEGTAALFSVPLCVHTMARFPFSMPICMHIGIAPARFTPPAIRSICFVRPPAVPASRSASAVAALQELLLLSLRFCVRFLSFTLYSPRFSLFICQGLPVDFRLKRCEAKCFVQVDGWVVRCFWKMPFTKFSTVWATFK